VETKDKKVNHLQSNRGCCHGYADLDCANPDHDVVSFFKHNIPIIGRRIGRLF